jgi:type I restriction enzyme, S subunit
LGLPPNKATQRIKDECWELPASWQWILFSEAADIASNLVNPREIPSSPHIAPENVEGKTGRLLPYKTIEEDGVISPKHRFMKGQIVYSKIRPYLRKAILAEFDGACSADMYPLTPKTGVNPRYLLYWPISSDFAAFSVEHERRTSFRKSINRGFDKRPFHYLHQPSRMRLLKPPSPGSTASSPSTPTPRASCRNSTRPSWPRPFGVN